jgi:molybdate transport system substrate-binding protein
MRMLGVVLAAALVVAACGGDSEPPLVVSAAASLKQAFTGYGQEFPDAKARFSFAGSDELAAQIEQGVKPDVYAAANTKLPDELYAKGLVEKPTVFAGNRLVLAVPGSGAKVASLKDLEAAGVKLAIGAADVPVGAYTRTVLDKLPAAQRQAILANVRTEEPDAGFLYISDVRGAEGNLKAIQLPAGVQPQVAYGVAVVKGAKHPEQARAFIDGLLDGPGADALKDAGFEPPPGQ